MGRIYIFQFVPCQMSAKINILLSGKKIFYLQMSKQCAILEPVTSGL
jgi:hypothetical protein